MAVTSRKILFVISLTRAGLEERETGEEGKGEGGKGAATNNERKKEPGQKKQSMERVQRRRGEKKVLCKSLRFFRKQCR